MINTVQSLTFNEDCIEGMKRYPDKYFDLAVVDPPYGIGASSKEKYHAGAFTEYVGREWDICSPSEEYFNELYRVSSQQIIFGANYFTQFLPVKKNWIVWDKLQPEGVSFSMHELAYYSGDGQARIFRGYNGGNRCTVKELAKKYIRIHPTQKPVALYSWIFKNYAKPTDKILDTHLGSGSSRIAAHKAGLDFTAFELGAEYFQAQEKRYKEFTDQFTLF